MFGMDLGKIVTLEDDCLAKIRVPTNELSNFVKIYVSKVFNRTVKIDLLKVTTTKK